VINGEAIRRWPASPVAEKRRERARRTALAIILAVFLAAAPDRGKAAESPSVWAYSLYKTLTYEIVANGADFILYTTLLSGTAAGAAPFLVVNALSAASTYYVHEVSWNLFGPIPETTAGFVELGLTKTLTYRVVSTAQHLAVAYAFTGSPWAAAGYAVAANISDAVIYIANEYGWDVYGLPVPGAAAAAVPASAPPKP